MFLMFVIKMKCPTLKILIFISSGGPGNPHREGYEWEQKFADFLTQIWDHNKSNEQKKYLFLVCHSFQLAVIHFGLRMSAENPILLV
jgi:GMP synthase-like glutamine amidotransferase